MKQIVVLTRRYYPSMSPISAVVDKYIQRLKDKYCFHIICIAGHSSLEKPLDPLIHVHYIKNRWLVLRLWAEEKYIKTSRSIFYLLLQLCRARSAFLGLFRDSLAYRWERDAYYKEISLISKQYGIDAIISVSGDTMFTHLAAKRFKEKFPTTRWITYFTDPYSLQDKMLNFALYNKSKNQQRRHAEELSIYNVADNIIATEELYQSVIDVFQQPKEKTICFKYVLERINNTDFTFYPTDSSTIKLIYAGAFYRKIRNPEPMLQIMKQVDSIQLDMYVSSKECDDILEKYQSGHIFRFPSVSIKEYKCKINQEYDILVNVGNDCDYQAPSKMLEYISTGKPIINFYYRLDSQYDMIDKYPLGLNVFVYDNQSISRISTFCRNMKGKSIPFEEIENIYPDNSLSRQVKILENLFNK